MCTKCTLFYLFLEEKKHCKRKTWARRWITLFLLIFECTSFYENLGDVLMPINCRSASEKNCSRVDLISRPLLQWDRPKLNNYQRKCSWLEIFKKSHVLLFLHNLVSIFVSLIFAPSFFASINVRDFFQNGKIKKKKYNAKIVRKFFTMYHYQRSTNLITVVYVLYDYRSYIAKPPNSNTFCRWFPDISSPNNLLFSDWRETYHVPWVKTH